MHTRKGLTIVLSAGIAAALMIGAGGCTIYDPAILATQTISDYAKTAIIESSNDSEADLLADGSVDDPTDGEQALPADETMPDGTGDEATLTDGSTDVSGDAASTEGSSAPVAQTVSVPNLVGMYQSDAFSALAGCGLSYNDVYVPSNEYTNGYVVRTDPVAGTAVEPGSTVVVFISMSDDWIVSFASQAPGMSEADVISALQSAGYTPMHLDIYDGYSDYIAQGRVLMVEPAGQAMIVYYGLSLGPQTPVYVEPEPAYEEPSPTYEEPEPVYEESSETEYMSE